MKKNEAHLIELKAAKAALQLLPQTGWHDLTLAKIAKAAKLPLQTILSRYDDTASLIASIVRLIDEDVKSALPTQAKDASLEDRLFDVLMVRFEALQKHRPAILILSEVTRKSPALAYLMTKAQTDSTRLMLSLVITKKLTPSNIRFILTLMGIYQISLCSWARDTSVDLSKTMATLSSIVRTSIRLNLFQGLEQNAL